jgi:TPR repeat protein
MGIQSTRRDHDHMMWSIARRVAAGLAAAVRNEAAKYAEALCASGQCAAALVPLQRAIDFGDTASLALLAQMMIHGREGVAKDRNRAFKLVEEGARLGCHHCQGVLACCYLGGYGIQRDAERSLELARESSGRGSRYGQFVLGGFYQYGIGGVAYDFAQALALYRLAAAQNFDEAQFILGWIYANGKGVARDHAEAMRLYQLAVAQGHPEALFRVASFHECGHGVPANKAEAIRWYRRAQAAGCSFATHALRMLGV